MTDDPITQVTAVLISFMRPGYTKICIDSLQKTYPGMKILVADNAGDQASKELEKFCKDRGVQYFVLPFDSGVCVARNFLVAHVETPYVLVGDDDFLYDKDAQVTEMTRFMMAHPEYTLIGGRIREKGQVKNYQGWVTVMKDALVYKKLDVENTDYQRCHASELRYCDVDLTFNFFVGRVSDIRQIPWDEHIKVAYEHSDWFIELKKQGKKSAFSPDPIVQHKPEGVVVPNEYKAYRLRRSDKDYFFRKHNLTFTIDMGGRKTFSNEREKILEIDFLIVTFMRPDALERLLLSIAEFYPEANVYIGDQNRKFIARYYRDLFDKLQERGMQKRPKAINLPYDCGLSYARNFLFMNTPNHFKLLLEDDFVFTADTKPELLYDIMKSDSSLRVVGGSVVQEGVRIPFEFNFVLRDRVLYQVPDGDHWQQFGAARWKFTQCVMNFALFRAEVMRKVEWDHHIKIYGEHMDFFYRLSKTDWRVGFTDSTSINHVVSKSPEYKEMRTRKMFFKVVFAKHDIDKIKYLNGHCELYDREKKEIITFREPAEDFGSDNWKKYV